MSLEIERLEQLGNGRYLVAFPKNFLLTENQSQIGRESADHVHGRVRSLSRSAQGLAINGNGAAQRRNNAANPTTEHRLELFGVDGTENPEEGVLPFLSAKKRRNQSSLT